MGCDRKAQATDSKKNQMLHGGALQTGDHEPKVDGREAQIPMLSQFE
jgi:hypothetical protein